MKRLANLFSDQAHAAAVRPTPQLAEQILDVACKAAIGQYRAGNPGSALFKLHRAGMAAERILGGPSPLSSTCGRCGGGMTRVSGSVWQHVATGLSMCPGRQR